jgi:hypothetical protein
MMPFAHSPLSSYAPLGCGDYNLTNFSPPGPTPPINSGRDPVNKPIPASRRNIRRRVRRRRVGRNRKRRRKLRRKATRLAPSTALSLPRRM